MNFKEAYKYMRQNVKITLNSGSVVEGRLVAVDLDDDDGNEFWFAFTEDTRADNYMRYLEATKLSEIKSIEVVE
jgi:hypothetical protein